MKIYFTASVTGFGQFYDSYKLVYDRLIAEGHEVSTLLDFTSLNKSNKIDGSLEGRKKAHEKIMSDIKKCDVVVAEVSHSSTNLGYEITSAIEREKPVLVLYTSGRAPMLLLGVETEKMRVVEYDEKNLSSQLSLYLDDLNSTVDTRFNFFISPKIGTYLDWISKKKRVPRAVYLRRLIEDDMKKAGYEE